MAWLRRLGVLALPLRSGAIRFARHHSEPTLSRPPPPCCVGNLRCGRGREVDALTTPLLHICIREQLATAPTPLILDLQPVRFLGCTGLTCLLEACPAGQVLSEQVSWTQSARRSQRWPHCVVSLRPSNAQRSEVSAWTVMRSRQASCSTTDHGYHLQRSGMGISGGCGAV